MGKIEKRYLAYFVESNSWFVYIVQDYGLDYYERYDFLERLLLDLSYNWGQKCGESSLSNVFHALFAWLVHFNFDIDLSSFGAQLLSNCFPLIFVCLIDSDIPVVIKLVQVRQNVNQIWCHVCLRWFYCRIIVYSNYTAIHLNHFRKWYFVALKLQNTTCLVICI